MKYKVELFSGPITTVQPAERLEELLNEYAQKGWELVNIIPQTSSSFDTSKGPEDVRVVDEVHTESNVLIFSRQTKIMVEV